MKTFVSLGLILINGILIAQQTDSKKYSVSAKSGLTIPIQGSYLRENWNIGPYVSLNLIRQTNVLDFVIGADYECLRLSDDKIKIVTPNIGILYEFNACDFHIVSTACIGYSWINFTLGKGVIVDPPIQYVETKLDGLSASLDVKLAYSITESIQICIGAGYLNIFKPFSYEDQTVDESKFMGLLRPNISVTYIF